MNGQVPRVAIFGIGSPHGDDQFGWLVVDQLMHRSGENVMLDKISNPIDVVESLHDYERVILIDAAVGMPVDVAVQKMNLANSTHQRQLQVMRHAGTHDFGLADVLRIAQSLNKPIDHLDIWVGKGERFDPLSAVSLSVEQAARECAAMIELELARQGECDARNVLG